MLAGHVLAQNHVADVVITPHQESAQLVASRLQSRRLADFTRTRNELVQRKRLCGRGCVDWLREFESDTVNFVLEFGQDSRWGEVRKLFLNLGRGRPFWGLFGFLDVPPGLGV